MYVIFVVFFVEFEVLLCNHGGFLLSRLSESDQDESDVMC